MQSDACCDQPPTRKVPVTSACQIVLTTCPDAETAGRIARALVEERLAACVNILPPMRSVYRWKGQVEEASELLLVIKSVTAQFAALRDRLQALHPYELPEIVAVPILDGLPEYLAWLNHPE